MELLIAVCFDGLVDKILCISNDGNCGTYAFVSTYTPAVNILRARRNDIVVYLKSLRFVNVVHAKCASPVLCFLLSGTKGSEL